MSTRPAIVHNSKLCADFIAAKKIVARYPKVSEQAALVPLDASGIFTFGYNPTICEHDDRILMAYRYHPDKTLATQLALAWLTSDGIVSKTRTLNISSGSNEDPRFFGLGKELFMSYVSSTWPEVPPKAVVRIGPLKADCLDASVQPRLPGNDGSEIQKNWVFFEHGSTLYCIYRSWPKQELYMINGDECSIPSVTPMPAWAYGPIKGGTTPLEYEGKLLRFAHSTLDSEWAGHHRRYYVLALLMDPKPPFRVLRVSKKPILFGSEIDDLPLEERARCHHWKSGVVFPGGAIARNGEFWLSLGINDSAVAIARIPPSRLHL